MHVLTVASLLLSWLVVAPATQAATVDVVSCMTIVPPYTTGIVQADLQCAGMFVAELETGATLDLNGHTIVGGVGSLAATKFEVVGPGTIVGSITLNDVTRKLTVRDLDIVADGWGIFAGVDHRVTVAASHVSITGASIAAIEALKVRLSDVRLDDNPLDNPTFSRGSAVFASRIKGNGVSASRNGIPGLPCPACAALYAFNVAKLLDLTAVDNAGYGVFAVTQLRLKDSTVTGNDGAGLGVDVAAGGGLITVNTTCGLSGSSEPPYTPGYWGVCSGD